MYKHSIIPLAVIVILFGFSARSWGTMEDQIEYDNTHSEWEQIFHPGGPEYRGQWVFGIEKFDFDKYMAEGRITPEGNKNSVLRLSGADNRCIGLWPSVAASTKKQMGGFSFNNDISSWINPPEGATRSISYVIREDYSGDNGPNNSDIVSIDENGVEMLLKHGGLMDLVPDTLGLEDPGPYYDVAISSLDHKADLEPVPFKYDHINAIYLDDHYSGIPDSIVNNNDEDAYFSSSKTGVFEQDHSLKYGVRVNATYGSQNGSGYSGFANGDAYRLKLDYNGSHSGEYIGFFPHIDSENGRWYHEVRIDEDITYKLYMENADGSNKAYDPAKYPEDPDNPFDPDAASGFPIRWHDDHELYLAGYIEDDPDPGTHAGRWVVERAEYCYFNAPTAYAHAGDVMSEVRTYNPYRNADGPENPHEWVYDGDGEMYVPDYYWDGENAPTPYNGEWDGDTPYERAFHLIGVVGSWTENSVKLPDHGTPPDGEHDWESREDTERREILLPNGQPDDDWNWTGTTGVLLESSQTLGAPSIALPDGVIWFYMGADPLIPGNTLWETHDEATPANPVEVTDWKAPEYNWRTFEGYDGVDQHPDYPDDDCSQWISQGGPAWVEWEYDDVAKTWSSLEVFKDVEDDYDNLENYDQTVNANWNNGVVSQQYFEHAWKIAGALLGDRFWEENPDYFWSNNLGAVATREYFDDQLLMCSPSHKMPVMVWNDVSGAWEFPSTENTENVSVWGFADTFEDTPVAGHDTLNTFMRYVMDIDALVIQDVNGNGIYDEEDYILFSLVDDSSFTKMMAWGRGTGDWIENTPFAGQFFSGETIFLYHGGEVMTYFDPATGIFFGGTAAMPSGDTLWGIPGFYDMNALDIGLVGGAPPIPEPSTLILLIGGGAAAAAGIIRRKIRK